MSKRTWAIVLALALIVGAAGGAAMAKSKTKSKAKTAKKMNWDKKQGMMGGKGMSCGMEMSEMEMHKGMMLSSPMVQKKLGLTKEQKMKIEEIKSGAMKKAIENEADMKTKHVELKDLMREQPMDAAKIDAKIDELGAAHAEMMKIRTHAMMDAKAVLTPEQEQKWMEMKEKMGKGMMEKGKMKSKKGKGMKKGKSKK